MKTTTKSGSRFSFHLLRNRLLSLSTVLIGLWVLTLWWGERLVFERSVSQCYWNNWETWQPSAHPHHILLVADPQLVDPHTYPGRPWPLSTLTIMYTDLYLRRSYRYLQDHLRPDSTLFLGDLFDGGREWATVHSVSPEARYKNIGTRFWLKEYFRFSKIFLRSWFTSSSASISAPMGRRIIASVPGNHDLGFATGIQMEVKNRFDAFFGPLNRVDVIGNHSIVSLDTVSLSAMDAINPTTGSSGDGDGSAIDSTTRMIWKPVEDFLVDAKSHRNRAVDREFQSMRSRNGEASTRVTAPKLQHEAIPLESRPPPLQEAVAEPRDISPSVPSSKFPTIVLSHVPLYRADGTNCGPNRERGTAIPLSAGYQYQNVLTPIISQDIIKHLASEEIVMIYSGDDHDYCEIEHNEFTGRIKEITVKSMSWAMGIRKPGVQLVSLYNPIDLDHTPTDNLPQSTPQNTVQNRLCLLPDQLSIFIRYAQLLGFTLFILLIHALRHKPTSHSHELLKDKPLLPIVFNDNVFDRTHSISQTSSLATVSGPDHQSHQNRFLARKLGGYGNLPAVSRSTSPMTPSQEISDPFAQHSSQQNNGKTVTSSENNYDADEDWDTSTQKKRKSKGKFDVFVQNVWRVVWPVLLVYFWLVWHG